MDFKIKKTIRSMSGLLLIVVGLISIGIGFTIMCTHPCNTVIFLGGIFIIIIGILVLIN